MYDSQIDEVENGNYFNLKFGLKISWNRLEILSVDFYGKMILIMFPALKKIFWDFLLLCFQLLWASFLSMLFKFEILLYWWLLIVITFVSFQYCVCVFFFCFNILNVKITYQRVFVYLWEQLVNPLMISWWCWNSVHSGDVILMLSSLDSFVGCRFASSLINSMMFSFHIQPFISFKLFFPFFCSEIAFILKNEWKTNKCLFLDFKFDCKRLKLKITIFVQWKIE